MESRSEIGVGFLGAGDISTLHAEAIRRLDGARLVGLWNYKENDVSAGGTSFSATARAAEYGCRKFETAEELLATPEISVIFVLTNAETHLQYVLMALRAGKHVLVEKPVGCTVAEIEEMRSLAEAKGLCCVPGHNYIHEPPLQRIKEMVQTEVIGRLTQVYIMYNIHHPEAVAARYPGVIRQIMTHHAYTSLYLMGDEPTSVSAMKATINDGSVAQENLAVLLMQMRSGALSVLQTSFANDDHGSDPWSFYIKVLGTKGSARYSYNDFVDNSKHMVHSHSYQAYPYTIYAQAEHFIDQCVRNRRPPLSSLQDAATSLRILEAAEASIRESRHVAL